MESLDLALLVEQLSAENRKLAAKVERLRVVNDDLRTRLLSARAAITKAERK